VLHAHMLSGITAKVRPIGWGEPVVNVCDTYVRFLLQSSMDKICTKVQYQDGPRRLGGPQRAAMHVQACMERLGTDGAFLYVDATNAFNTIERASLLDVVETTDELRELQPSLRAALNTESCLLVRDRNTLPTDPVTGPPIRAVLTSAEGVIQGHCNSGTAYNVTVQTTYEWAATQCFEGEAIAFADNLILPFRLGTEHDDLAPVRTLQELVTKFKADHGLRISTGRVGGSVRTMDI
jgi:hypothetical protein